MHGLARMLLFWQAVEELRLVEYRQGEATVRDRLAWTLYKTFLHEGASILNLAPGTLGTDHCIRCSL